MKLKNMNHVRGSSDQPKTPLVEQRAWDRSYGEAYDLVQARVFGRTGKAGPLNIYDPRNRNLIVFWAVCPGTKVLWDRLREMWSDEDAPLTFIEAASNMTSPARKATVTRKVNSELQRMRLPTSQISLPVATSRHKAWAKGFVNKCLSSLPRLSAARRSHLIAKTKITVRRLQNIRWMRNGIGGAKHADLSLIQGMSEDEKLTIGMAKTCSGCLGQLT